MPVYPLCAGEAYDGCAGEGAIEAREGPTSLHLLENATTGVCNDIRRESRGRGVVSVEAFLVF